MRSSSSMVMRPLRWESSSRSAGCPTATARARRRPCCREPRPKTTSAGANAGVVSANSRRPAQAAGSDFDPRSRCALVADARRTGQARSEGRREPPSLRQTRDRPWRAGRRCRCRRPRRCRRAPASERRRSSRRASTCAVSSVQPVADVAIQLRTLLASRRADRAARRCRSRRTAPPARPPIRPALHASTKRSRPSLIANTPVAPARAKKKSV